MAARCDETVENLCLFKKKQTPEPIPKGQSLDQPEDQRTYVETPLSKPGLLNFIVLLPRFRVKQIKRGQERIMKM